MLRPPKDTKKEIDNLMESLTDAISEAKAKADSPWLIMGGDWNRYNTKLITDTFTDLIKRNTEATRGTAVLDYSFTNFESMITESEVCFPLERIDNASIITGSARYSSAQ